MIDDDDDDDDDDVMMMLAFLRHCFPLAIGIVILALLTCSSRSTFVEELPINEMTIAHRSS